MCRNNNILNTRCFYSWFFSVFLNLHVISCRDRVQRQLSVGLMCIHFVPTRTFYRLFVLFCHRVINCFLFVFSRFSRFILKFLSCVSCSFPVCPHALIKVWFSFAPFWGVGWWFWFWHSWHILCLFNKYHKAALFSVPASAANPCSRGVDAHSHSPMFLLQQRKLQKTLRDIPEEMFKFWNNDVRIISEFQLSFLKIQISTDF